MTRIIMSSKVGCSVFVRYWKSLSRSLRAAVSIIPAKPSIARSHWSGMPRWSAATADILTARSAPSHATAATSCRSTGTMTSSRVRYSTHRLPPGAHKTTLFWCSTEKELLLLGELHFEEPVHNEINALSCLKIQFWFPFSFWQRSYFYEYF